MKAIVVTDQAAVAVFLPTERCIFDRIWLQIVTRLQLRTANSWSLEAETDWIEAHFTKKPRIESEHHPLQEFDSEVPSLHREKP